MFACMRAYRCNNPGDCWCIGCENNTAVVLTKQPDGRAPVSSITWTRQLLPFFGAEDIIFYHDRLAFHLQRETWKPAAAFWRKPSFMLQSNLGFSPSATPEDFQSELAALGSCRLVPENCAARAATSILTFSSARCECGMKWGTEAGPIDI